MAIRNLSDIAAIETVPLAERGLPQSSYAALASSAKRTPDAKALSFFLSADRLDATHVWTYAELLGEVTRAANAFATCGVATDRPVAFVLPNLPETHFTIWGGETAGAALAIKSDARAEADREFAAVRQSLGPGHARPGFEPEGMVRLGGGARFAPRAENHRVCRHGRLPRQL